MYALLQPFGQRYGEKPPFSDNLQMSPDTLFDLASLTKVVATTSATMIVRVLRGRALSHVRIKSLKHQLYARALNLEDIVELCFFRQPHS